MLRTQFFGIWTSNYAIILQIFIHIENPGDITITAKLNSSSSLEIKSPNSDEFSCSFNVKYLNPIVLTCLLPKSYPSHLPPYYTISIRWLDSARISRLCSVLDGIWSEQVGQEVVYQWVEWLQMSSLAYLQLDKEIMLGPYDKGHSGDTRAVSGSVSPEVDIPAIINYDNQRRDEEFCMNLQECCICLSQFAGKLHHWLNIRIRCYCSPTPTSICMHQRELS